MLYFFGPRWGLKKSIERRKPMQNASISSVHTHLKIAMRDLREVMDDIQGMYYHLFVRMLQHQKDLEFIQAKLLDASPELDEPPS